MERSRGRLGAYRVAAGGSVSSAIEYWRSGQGLAHITPPGTVGPEGEGFIGYVSDLLAAETVIDLGCGTGRLARCFNPALYIGVDLNRAAVEIARSKNTCHQFRVVGDRDPLPPADVVLAHTVLLHVPDDHLSDLVGRMAAAAPRIVVSEILGCHWRRPGNPPVFNREQHEYEAAFALHGFALHADKQLPYSRYGPEDHLTIMDFRS